MPLTRQYLMLAAAESTYGTPEVLAGTDAHLVMSPSFKIESQAYNRPIGHSLIAPSRASVIQRKRVGFTFQSELKGNASAYDDDPAIIAPDYHALLQACGFVGVYGTGTWTYTRENPVTKGATLQLERGGQIVTGAGCRGNLKVDFIPGQVVMPAWDFKGLYAPVTDAVMTEPDYTADILPPQCAATGFDPWSGGLAAGEWGHIRKASLDLRNNVVYQDSMTVGTYGAAGVHILGYGGNDDPGSILTVEIETGVTTDEWYDRWETREIDDTTADLAITIGSDAHNTHVFQLSRLYVRNLEQLDMDGRMGLTIEFGLLASVGANTLNDLVILAS